jgi:hypothetical protein
MKTTIEIADELLACLQEVAQREGTTMRALIEEGLRAVLAQREKASYYWPDLSVDGEGLSPGVVEGSWESLVY